MLLCRIKLLRNNNYESFCGGCTWGGSEMRRICCFCESWESGGIESFLHNILLRIDLTGQEVDIVAAQLKDSVFTQVLREHGVRFR